MVMVPEWISVARGCAGGDAGVDAEEGITLSMISSSNLALFDGGSKISKKLQKH